MGMSVPTSNRVTVPVSPLVLESLPRLASIA